MQIRRFRALACVPWIFCGAGLAYGDDPAPSPPPPPWTGNVGLGVSLTRGNADTDNVSLTGAVQYDPKARGVFKADAGYLRADSGGVATVDRASAGARLEEKIGGGRAFVFGEGRYLRDAFKQIHYLLTPLVGIGYALVKNDHVTFSVDTALGGAFEKDDDVGSTSSGALRFGEALSWKLSKTATLTQAGTALYKTNDFEDALYHGEVALAASVTKRSELKVSLLDDFKNRPVNPTLAKNDLTLLAALVMKF